MRALNAGGDVVIVAVDAAAAGVAPSILEIGPVPATRKLLARAPISGIEALDLIELDEGFASQSVACVSELGIDPAIVYVNGGAIALGHPLGRRRARMVGTLVRELRARKGRYGLASLCIGVGQGISSAWEAL